MYKGGISMASKLKALGQFLLKVLIRILMISTATLVITYIVSTKVDTDFPRLLEYAGFILMGVGALSVMGSLKLSSNLQYHLTRMKINSDTSSREFLDQTLDCFKFMIYMGFSGVLVLAIALKLY